MRSLALVFLVTGVFAQELTVEKVFRDTLSNNLELKALELEVKALEREYESAKGSLFPNLKLEERFVKTDIPAHVLFIKLNQERVTLSSLNDPSPVSGFETALRVEVPLWLGGKLRAFRDMALHRKLAKEKELSRREEEILFDAFRSFLKASLSRSAIEVARKNLRDAEEHKRIAEKMYETGTALLSDVLRAQVFVSKSRESLFQARSDYELSIKSLSLISNTDYTGYDVPPLSFCPSLSKGELLEKALRSREDLRAIEEYLKVLREGYRAQIANNLPQVVAFVSYNLYDRDIPFGSEGKGYMFGLSVSLSINTGLSSLKKAQSFAQREKALLKKREFMEKAILFEVEEAHSRYEVALEKLRSARDRVRQAEETLRIVKVRYSKGLARMVDLLDAQTHLERARFDHIKALYECNLYYGKALLSAGILREVLR